jgi:hypothetical protein
MCLITLAPKIMQTFELPHHFPPVVSSDKWLSETTQPCSWISEKTLNNDNTEFHAVIHIKKLAGYQQW